MTLVTLLVARMARMVAGLWVYTVADVCRETLELGSVM